MLLARLLLQRIQGRHARQAAWHGLCLRRLRVPCAKLSSLLSLRRLRLQLIPLLLPLLLLLLLLRGRPQNRTVAFAAIEEVVGHI